jgi:hypothetical protein
LFLITKLFPYVNIFSLTPPVGNALFVGCAVGKATIEEVMPSLIICYIPMVVILFIITFFPQIGVFSMPYLFRSQDHMWNVLNGPVGQHFMAAMAPIYAMPEYAGYKEWVDKINATK